MFSCRWDIVPSVCDDFHAFENLQNSVHANTCAAVNYPFSCSTVGIVKTSVIVTGVQVCSRIFMVWFVTSSIRQVSITFFNSATVYTSIWQIVFFCLFLYYHSIYLYFFAYFTFDLNKDPEWRKCNPIPGCVDGDRDYQIFLLHIQPAQPPATLHQMGQVEMPLPMTGMSLNCHYCVGHCVWACRPDLAISPLACFPHWV